jgi:hypothetical protein
MKKYIGFMLLTVIIGSIEAANTNSFQFIDHLLKLKQPEKPLVVEDSVIFTASSGYRRVGIAFAHEDFGKIYWFQKLMISNENSGPWIKDRPPADLHRDSGILFYIYPIPDQHNGALEYRLIIDGLWVKDPLNPNSRVDSASGITRSVVPIPYVKRPNTPESMPAGTIVFSFAAPSGESITVAGSFNSWDPFMYELRETTPGQYTLSLPVPPGVYQYVYFYRGERRLDPNNPNRIYTREGKAANEITVK